VEAKLIEPRLAKLFELCLNHGATWLTQNDTSLDWVANLLPAEVGEMIEKSLPEYAPISVYSMPRKEGDNRVRILVVGHKDGQSYSLISDSIPVDDREAGMSILREAADRLRRPWNYQDPEKQQWIIGPILVGIMALLPAVGMLWEFGLRADTLKLVFLEATAVVALCSVIAIVPKMFWERRRRKIENLFDAIPA